MEVMLVVSLMVVVAALLAWRVLLYGQAGENVHLHEPPVPPALFAPHHSVSASKAPAKIAMPNGALFAGTGAQPTPEVVCFVTGMAPEVCTCPAHKGKAKYHG